MAEYQFRETLPAGCPPEDAVPPEQGTLLRFAPNRNIQDQYFDSHQKTGKKKPFGVSLCGWSSCSMFKESKPREEILRLRGLPNLRGMKCLMYISVDGNIGVSQYGLKEHVDIWFFKNVDVVSLVSDIEDI